MDIKYTDQQIAELINERKVLPDDWRIQLDKNDSLYIIGERGNRFRIITNLNKKYPSDFSVILAVVNPKKGADFRIRRYNGMHKRPHNNKIEKQKIYGYHIHSATERYQERGYDEEAYAEKTDRYNNLKGALHCLIQDANFELPAQLELKLF
jgi:hypothetical protein